MYGLLFELLTREKLPKNCQKSWENAIAVEINCGNEAKHARIKIKLHRGYSKAHSLWRNAFEALIIASDGLSLDK